jgi:hypothetical protein
MNNDDANNKTALLNCNAKEDTIGEYICDYCAMFTAIASRMFLRENTDINYYWPKC